MSQVGSRDAWGGRGFLSGRRGQTVAAWSMCWERSVVNCEARVSRVSGVAEVYEVLRISAWRVAVWLMRSGVLDWYAFMWSGVRGRRKVSLRVVCCVWGWVWGGGDVP